VIGGFTQPAGEHKHMGALLVGVYENGKLKFAGRVGTGFSEKLLRSLSEELNKIAVESCPFSNLPATGHGLDPGLTVAEMKRCFGLSRRWFVKSNSRSGLGMTGSVSPYFSGSGKTRARARSSDRRQVRQPCPDLYRSRRPERPAHRIIERPRSVTRNRTRGRVGEGRVGDCRLDSSGFPKKLG
jgi:ATP dependent DNA ligase C terminal region